MIAVGGIAAIFSAGIGALIAIASLVQLLRYVLDFMLNGKLICLHRDPANNCVCSSDGGTVCVIGEVADTEDVGEDKNPVEDVDNDYAMNVIPSPFDMGEFANHDDPQENFAIATAPTQPQGDLLRMQPGMPTDDGKPMFTAYFRTMVMTRDGHYNAWTEIIGRDYGWFGIAGPDQQKQWGDYLLINASLEPVKKFAVPVIHCEFEGSRIHDMLAAIEAFSLGGGWCKENWFFRPLCTVLQVILAPFALIAVAVAWAAAKDGDPANALPGGGTIRSKDLVVARGRWTYDGGHEGWNEIHATRIVQKVSSTTGPTGQALRPSARVGAIGSPRCPTWTCPAFTRFRPSSRRFTTTSSAPKTSGRLHPEVDGCDPAGDDGQPPPIR